MFSPLVHTPNLLLIVFLADSMGTVPTCISFWFSSLLQTMWVMYSQQRLGQSLVKLFFLLVTRIFLHFINSAAFMFIPNNQKPYLPYSPQCQTPIAPTMFPFQVLLLMWRTFTKSVFIVFSLLISINLIILILHFY